MRILLTGSSSFTGSWFARYLAAAGHEVTATFRASGLAYQDELRSRRAARVAEVARTVTGVAFGDDAFVDLVRSGRWDVLAHHGADVTNYRSLDFDVAAALRGNTHRLRTVLEAFLEAGGRRVVLTGSVFEGGEGAGSQGLPDFSPYGLSKALTARVFAFHCERAGISLGKFVIPNPFGPLEEPRYTAYLVRSWLKSETPSCANPAYVRDNVHVSLLARSYVRFVETLPGEAGFVRRSPSGYVESQGAFTRRLAAEMRPRLGRPCPVVLREQVEFPEPVVRINTEPAAPLDPGWSEAAAWDEMARHYLEAGAA